MQSRIVWHPEFREFRFLPSHEAGGSSARVTISSSLAESAKPRARFGSVMECVRRFWPWAVTVACGYLMRMG